MFLDEVEISVKAGDGGNGGMSFHRAKYVAKGGPDGGNGGCGGNVILRATANLNTLQHFKGVKLFLGGNGASGGGQLMAGKAGEDKILEVPVGTLILKNGKIVKDLAKVGESFLAVRGGLGGKGNANFTSSTRQAPRFAELGEPGELKKLKLELKLVADVGIIGLPSVGKSTLISKISAARPKIAAYHFTTLTPNLGVVDFKNNSFVVTDLPGLIKNASKGKGLGIQFLKHAERVNFFWHLVDATSSTPTTDYRVIREELRKFNPKLAAKPEIVVLNKADIVDETALEKIAQKLEKVCKSKPLIISAATKNGVEILLNKTIEALGKMNKPAENLEPLPVFRPHLEEKSKSFTVKRKNKNLYLVDGPRLNQIVIMSDTTNVDAVARIQDVLNRMGVNRELRRAGAEDGAKIEIAGKRIEWWG
ncbi:MAG: GTPase ObgE [Candidatus Gracilibacteria bacterium]|nr:GTPase ObgE [Candidatus Gracilibacteria bacterium]MDD5179293.1 GTPase ObgE [Candidatus Gracilibacteria bacterium]